MIPNKYKHLWFSRKIRSLKVDVIKNEIDYIIFISAITRHSQV